MASTNIEVAVKVSDLFEVYPELDGGEPLEEFAKKVVLAAELARREDAYEDLRDRLKPAAGGFTVNIESLNDYFDKAKARFEADDAADSD